MNDLIVKTGVKLGDTDSGSAWAMKALNPAAPLALQGIPDSSCLARVVKHFERTITVSFAAAAANWNLDVLLHPNPWTPACTLTYDGATATFAQVINTQLGASDDAIRTFLYEQTEAYRVCYASMTAIMDATSITNSGLVAATQYMMVPLTGSCEGKTFAIDGVARTFEVWPDPPRNYDQLIQMPGTYVGEAKEGCYLPLRIDPELKWVHSNDERLHINVDDAIAKGWTGHNLSGSTLPVAAGHTTSWPFGIYSCDATPTAVFEYPNSQRTVGHMAMRNLNPAASIRITYRMGFEFLVAPGTTYSPDLRVPPPYDQVALEAYKAVASQLKLAYPASYNDWQKIVKTISDIASTVLPFLPGGQLLSGIVPVAEKGVLAIGGKIAEKVNQRRAMREQAQQTQAAPSRARPARNRRRQRRGPAIVVQQQPAVVAPRRRLTIVRRR
jgi:hypothetical protein